MTRGDAARAKENRLAPRGRKVKRLLGGDGAGDGAGDLGGEGGGLRSGRKLNNSLKFPGEEQWN